MSMNGWQMMRSLTQGLLGGPAQAGAGHGRRVVGYARPYRRQIIAFLVLVVIDAALVVAPPLLLKPDHRRRRHPGQRGAWSCGCRCSSPRSRSLDAVMTLMQRWYSSRIGEGLIYDLRTQVFAHVQRQPIAFFTRTQTGALVTRLNNDVIGAQQAFTSTLSGRGHQHRRRRGDRRRDARRCPGRSPLAALLLVPLFLIPARLMGRRLAGLTREPMQLNAEHGHPHDRALQRRRRPAGQAVRPARRSRSSEYAERAGRVRDIGVKIAMNRTVFFAALTLVAVPRDRAWSTASAGCMAVNGALTVGTLLALAALLGRLYGPLTALSNVRVDVMTALVSFERVFEVLDLEPLVTEAPRRGRPRRTGPVAVEFDDVALPLPVAPTRSRSRRSSRSPRGDREAAARCCTTSPSASAPGQLVALVGPSRRRQDDDHRLVARLYDPTRGSVRLGGLDLRDVSWPRCTTSSAW